MNGLLIRLYTAVLSHVSVARQERLQRALFFTKHEVDRVVTIHPSVNYTTEIVCLNTPNATVLKNVQKKDASITFFISI